MAESELKILEQKTTDVVVMANKMVVDSQEKYNKCDEFLSIIKGLKKEVDLAFDKNINDAYQLHRNMVASKKVHSDPLNQAEDIIKKKSIVWINEQQRIQTETQTKLAEEARKKEEMIRKTKEEQERIWRNKEAAARAKYEQMMNIATEATDEQSKANALVAAEEARIEAEKAAKKAEERKEEAEQVYIPVPIAGSTFQQAQGQSIRTVWKCEVIDMRLLCNEITKGLLPAIMVLPNQTQLNNLAKAVQGTKSYQGLRFYTEDSIIKRIN